MARESKLNQFTDSELRELGPKGLFEKGLYASVNGAWNALYLKPNGRLCGEAPVKAESTNGEKKAAVISAFRPAAIPVLPGRVEDYFVETIGWDETIKIQPHHVELCILSDNVAWNRKIMRFGKEERDMLGSFLKAGGFNPEPTLTDRADSARKEAARKAEIETNIRIAQDALAEINPALALDTNVSKAIRAFYS